MKKEDAISAGLSEEVIAFVMSEQRNNRVLNQEGMEIGDKITIEGVSNTVSNFAAETTTENGEKATEIRSFIEVKTSGDRDSISISRLVGTGKRRKYFPDYDKIVEKYGDKLLTLPRREGDALMEINTKHKGKTYEVVAMVEDCGPWEQTFYLFAEV